MRLYLLQPSFPTTIAVREKTMKFFWDQNFHSVSYCLMKKKDLLFAGSQEEREEDFKEAINFTGDYVWAMRGGYGAIKLLPYVAKFRPSQLKRMKLIGYSDITALHVYLNQRKIVTFHGPNAGDLASDDYSHKEKLSWFRFMKEPPKKVEFKIKPMNNVAKKQSKYVHAQLLGGNLVTFHSLLGTPYLKKLKNEILFFEEIEEPAYKVDRILTQLTQSGQFKNISGVVFGDFLNNDEYEERKVKKILKQWASEQTFPVCYGLPTGHGSKNKLIYSGGYSSLKKDKLINTSKVMED